MSREIVPWKPPALVERLCRHLPELKFRPKPPLVIRRAGQRLGQAVKREAQAQLADMFGVVEDRRQEKRAERLYSRQRRERSPGLLPGDPGTSGMHYIGELYVWRRGGFVAETGKWIAVIVVIAFLLSLGGLFDPAEPEPRPAPTVQPIRIEDI